jgi:hypothetical protein
VFTVCHRDGGKVSSRMATRDEIVRYLTEEFPAIDLGGLKHGVVSLSVISESGENVVLIIDFFESVLTLTRPIAKIAAIEPEDAIASVRGFGLVEFSGAYAVRHVVLTDELTPSNLGAYIDSLANDSLRT